MLSLLLQAPSPAVCLVVFKTRRLFEKQSDTHDAEIPRAADRKRKSTRSSSLDTTGRASFKKLYVKNHGKWPAAVEKTRCQMRCVREHIEKQVKGPYLSQQLLRKSLSDKVRRREQY